MALLAEGLLCHSYTEGLGDEAVPGLTALWELYVGLESPLSSKDSFLWPVSMENA